MTSGKRRAAAQRGRCAEQAVADHLTNTGCSILGRNVRVGNLEIDIVARNGSTILVVEVRHRGASAWESPLESITEPKQNRIRRAAERLWNERFDQDPTAQSIRFDVAAVTFTPQGPVIEYLEGAMD